MEIEFFPVCAACPVVGELTRPFQPLADEVNLFQLSDQSDGDPDPGVLEYAGVNDPAANPISPNVGLHHRHTNVVVVAFHFGEIPVVPEGGHDPVY